jgi:hypothetical protein
VLKFGQRAGFVVFMHSDPRSLKRGPKGARVYPSRCYQRRVVGPGQGDTTTLSRTSVHPTKHSLIAEIFDHNLFISMNGVGDIGIVQLHFKFTPFGNKETRPSVRLDLAN